MDRPYLPGRSYFHLYRKGAVGLVTGKRAVVILSRDGVYPEGPAQALDFRGYVFNDVLGFLGISDLELVIAEGVSVGEKKTQCVFRDKLDTDSMAKRSLIPWQTGHLVQRKLDSLKCPKRA